MRILTTIVRSRVVARNSPIKVFLQGLERAGSALETALLVGILSAMMLFAVGQIVMREIFESGFGWTDQLIGLMVLWLALVGSVAACRENRHIRIDALSHVLPELLVKLVRIIVDLFAAAVCAMIAYQAWRYLNEIEVEYEVTVLVDTPAWIAHMIMPIAFGLMSYRFAVSSLQSVVHFSDDEPSENAE